MNFKKQFKEELVKQDVHLSLTEDQRNEIVSIAGDLIKKREKCKDGCIYTSTVNGVPKCAKCENGNDFIGDVSTSTDIEVGNIVKYLPKDAASWIGVVTEIKNDEETKRHGHSGDVYIVQDPFSTASIATRKENLLKGEFA